MGGFCTDIHKLDHMIRIRSYNHSTAKLGKVKEEKKKAISVTDLAGLKVCEMLRIPHCLHNWLTDGGEGVRLMRLPSSTLLKTFSCF
jgi:hypothetical protein